MAKELLITKYMLLAILTPTLPLQAQEETHFFRNVVFGATIEVDLARSIESGESQKEELIFQPKLKFTLPDDSRFTGIARVRRDFADRLNPREPEQVTTSSWSQRVYVGDVELELREFYFTKVFGSTFLTLGKQQVVWGQADTLKVLDVVNPQDFREFLLDDFDDSRIPLWMLKSETSFGDHALQLLWIPDRTYNELPDEDGTYAFTAPQFKPVPPPGIPVNLLPVERPDDFFKDADYGMRLSLFLNGWDVTFNYLYHYHDMPIFFSELRITGLGPEITVSPRYERSHLIGNTFSNAFGNLTLRGEIGWSLNRFFLAADPMDADGVVKADELVYLFGFDYYGFSETILSLQLFQNRVFGEQGPLVREKVATGASLFLSRDFMNDRLSFELTWSHNTSSDDGLIRPYIKFEYNDMIDLRFGGDFFYGDARTLYGQFDKNDRIYVGIKANL